VRWYAIGIDGNLDYRVPDASGGASSASVGVDSTTNLDALKFAAMIAAEARSDRISILSDFIHLDLGHVSSAVRSADLVQVARNRVSTTLDYDRRGGRRVQDFSLSGPLLAPSIKF
jgi:hypothetical protein